MFYSHKGGSRGSIDREDVLLPRFALRSLRRVLCTMVIVANADSMSRTIGTFVLEAASVLVLTSQASARGKSVESGIGETNDGQENPPTFSGDGACLPCHKDKSSFYLRTSHHLASQEPEGGSILGSFKDAENVLEITKAGEGLFGDGLYFRMEAENGRFYQTAVRSTITETGHLTNTAHRERIDIVTGSGVRGQSYLYWHKSQLFELPVSYWSALHQWINSPGYEDGTANFDRPVYPRCLECHATYIKTLSSDQSANSYETSSLVVGILCEKCHGPGGAHVALETKHPLPQTEPQAILNPARWSRDRKVDLCALCHNGVRRKALSPAFSYTAGDPLDTYLGPDLADSSMHPEVHGNQVALLKRSRCYQASPDMSCLTCHDVHAPEHPASEYSRHCLSCHQIDNCSAAKHLGGTAAADCVSCHMPVQPTTAIISQTAGKLLRTSMRTHWIRVYPNQ
jgi:hypothetical protein